MVLRRSEIYSSYYALMAEIVEQGHLIIEKSRLKASKHFVFHGAKAYEPPAFGVRPLERIEVKKYVVRGESFKLAEKALKLLEEVRRYRQNAVLPTPWLARMENNLQVIARKLREVH